MLAPLVSIVALVVAVRPPTTKLAFITLGMTAMACASCSRLDGMVEVGAAKQGSSLLDVTEALGAVG